MCLFDRIELLDSLFAEPRLEGLPASVSLGWTGNGPELHIERERALHWPPFLPKRPPVAICLRPVVKARDREKNVPIRRLSAFRKRGQSSFESSQCGIGREGEDDSLLFL